MSEQNKRTLEQVRADINNSGAEIEAMRIRSEQAPFNEDEANKFDKLLEQYQADQALEQTLVRGERAKQLLAKRSDVFGGPSNVGIGVSKKRAATKGDYNNALRAWVLFDENKLPFHEADHWKRSCELVESDWTAAQFTCRAQSTDVADEGQDLVNGSIFQSFVDARQWEGTILEYCDVSYTQTGETIHHCIANDTGVYAAYSAQNTQVTDTPIVIDKVAVGYFTAKTGMVPISKDIVRDSQTDVLAYFNAKVGDRMRRTIIRDVSFGNGSGKAQGIFYGSVAATGATGYSNYIYDYDVRELEASIDPDYVDSPKFAFFAHPDTMYKMERTLVDGSGSSLWGENMQLGQPRVLRGKPFVKNRWVPTMVPGTEKHVLFAGDFSHHKVRFVGGPVLARKELEDQFAVGLYGAVPFDARYVNPGNDPIKALVTGTLSGDSSYTDPDLDGIGG